MSLEPGCILLSLESPIMTVRVDVPVIGGFPLSLITMGTRYSFCCSLSKERSEDTTAIPSPLAPSVTMEISFSPPTNDIRLTGVVLHFEGSSDDVLGVGIHSEGEGRSIAF